MRGEAYLYDVFISYRQIQPDQTVGEALQRALESFRTPRTLVHAGVPQRLRRVFRDRSELAASSDLNAQIVDALRQSRFLVVVCSLRTRESQWITREVDLFRELHGADRILLLLLDGEPRDAYPASLARDDSEPLAADIRAPSVRESLRRLRTVEKLRLLAPILGVAFDDLWQRERRRRRQRLILAGSLATLVLSALGGLAWLTTVQTREKELTARIAALTDHATHLAGEGRPELATQLAILAHRFDPDGRLGMESRVYAALRRSLATRHFNQTIAYGAAPPTAAALSRDGKLLAIGRRGGSLEVLASSGGTAPALRKTFQALEITAIAFVPGDSTLAVGFDDGAVWLVAIEGGELRASPLGECGTVDALAVSPGGEIIAAATQEEGVCLLERTKPNVVSRRSVPGMVHTLDFSPDGKWLAAGHKGGISLWASAGNTVSATSAGLALPDETVTAIAFSASHFAAGSHTDFGVLIKEALLGAKPDAADRPSRGFLRLWPLNRLAGESPKVPADVQRILALGFSQDGRILASAGVDGGIRLWDVANAVRPARELQGHRGAVVVVAFDRGGERLVSAGTDGSVRLWRLVGPPDGVVPTDAAVLSLAFVARRRLAAAVKLANSPLIVELPLQRPPSPRTVTPGSFVRSVAASDALPQQLAFGTGTLPGAGGDAGVRLWDLAAGRFPTERRVAHESDVDALAFGAGARWLASAGALDNAVKLLETRAGRVLEIRLRDRVGKVYALALHPRGDPPLLAVGADGVVVIVDPVADRQTLVRHAFGAGSSDWAVLDLEFSPSGESLATTAPDGKVRLWRVGEWARPAALLEPLWTEGPIAARQLAFNPATGELAVGYQDGSLRVWKPGEKGRRPLLLNAAGRTVQSLAYDPSGTVLAAGFATGDIEVWSTPQSLLEIGCAERPRELTDAEWTSFVGSGVDRVEACPVRAEPPPPR